MRPISRRALLGLAIAGGVGAAGLAEALMPGVPRPRPAADSVHPRSSGSPSGPVSVTVHETHDWRIVAARSGPDIATENRFTGSPAWAAGPATRTRAAGDSARQIQGYASATSVNPGEVIAFHVSVASAGVFGGEIYRLGWYGGAGARRMAVSEGAQATTQPLPVKNPATRMLECDWPVTTALRVPDNWMPGFYLGVFTSSDGFRSYVPFVVRDDSLRVDLCVVLPFTTYQAYNLWPLDGANGASLYYGYQGGEEVATHRAYHVSFDRPYVGPGLPTRSDEDLNFIRWAEKQGYAMTYATSVDLHAGRIDPAAYRGLIFPGHDEYWSQAMRDTVERAVTLGKGVAFLGANNVYWRIRMSAATTTGTDHRVVECYKGAKDPGVKRGGSTGYWRSMSRGGQHNEQQLLGVQYVSMVRDDAPLVVRAAGHWLWAGTGVRNGDQIPHVVGGEADGLTPKQPTPRGGTWTLVSASPFLDRTPAKKGWTQHTSVWETPHGGVVFTAGSLCWTRALHADGYVDGRIQRATANVFARITRGNA